MEVKKVMSLEFFAKRIGVSVRRLNWCIIQTKNRDWERNTFPAISIKDSALYYDFLNDELDTIVNYGETKTIVMKTKMTKTKEGYRFDADEAMIEFPSERIEKFYKNKVYSEELNREAQRFA